jgi:MFS family permease
VTRLARKTFKALQVRNYRLYFVGQIVSVSGTWMQGVAQSWLVLQLTGSGAALGLVLGAQFLPTLVAGPLGGVVADRFPKRRLLLITNTAAGLLALVLGLLTATGLVQLWMVFVLAFLLGITNALDNPARQTFVQEMVGPQLLPNAVSLNSVVMNSSRMIGPATAGVLIATVGLAACFLINAASYLAVLVALALMRTKDLELAPTVARAKGQLREGFRYVWATPALRTPLLMMAAIGTLTYEFAVTLPLLARFTFDGTAGTYAAMSVTMASGAVAGGLVVASRGVPTSRRLTGAAFVFGLVVLAVAAAPTLPVVFLLLPLLGASSITFIASSNATLQLTAPAEMKGRVMALFAVAFLGTTPIGGPIVGWVAQATDPRIALALGGVVAVTAAIVGARSLRRNAPQHVPALEVPPTPLVRTGSDGPRHGADAPTAAAAAAA